MTDEQQQNQKPDRHWHPADTIVAVLACSIAFVIVITSTNSFITGERLNTEQADNMRLVILGMLNIVSYYVGSKVGRALERKGHGG